MKKTLFILFGSLLLLVSACQKKEESAAPAGYAVTPQPCNNPYAQTGTLGVNSAYCYNGQPTSYHPYYSNPYQNQPWYMGAYYNNWYWPYQWNYQGSNCGCPIGYQAMYHPHYGVACAPAQTYNSSYYVTYNWNYYGGYNQNNQWLNQPQAQYQYQAITGCQTQQNAVGCDVRANNCSAGYMCVPISGGSTVGTCQPR